MTGKTIWILNHYAITPDLSGGTRHFDLGRELVRLGHQVVIFASGFDHASRRYVKVGPKDRLRVEELEKVQFTWLPTFAYHRNDWRRMANMLSYGSRVLSVAHRFAKPDVVVGSSMHPAAAMAGWWLARKHRARFVFEVRDLWPQTAIDMGAMKNTSLSARLLYAWEKFMCLKAEKVVVLMPGAKQYLESRGIDPGKVCWIPNGVDVARFVSSTSLGPSTEVGQVFQRYRDKFRVVYAGAHGPVNGLDVAIEAAALLGREEAAIHFILVGDGPEKEALREKAKELGCENVTFCEPVPKASIPAVLRQADLLMQCLRPVDVLKYGGSSNKVNDYLASGRPVIVSAAVAQDVVTEAGAGVTVPPGDAQALAGGILKLYLMSSDERTQLGANGRAYVEKYHNIELLGEKLAEILRA